MPIEVAHGDGLAGGSVNSPGSHAECEWIETAASVLQRARPTTLLLPGVGTIHELKTAYDLRVRSVRAATLLRPLYNSGSGYNANPQIALGTNKFD
jgi:4-hydroxy 2-oxovalerate aldolase